MNTRVRIAGALLVAAVAVTMTLPAQTASTPETQTTLLSIKGMTCGGCAASVKSALKKIDGVHDVKVSFKQKKAQVSYDPAKTNPKALADAVTKAGFKTTPDEQRKESQ